MRNIRTTCGKGHEFNEKNTYEYFHKKSGEQKRYCRRCTAIRATGYRNAKKTAT